MPRTSCPFPGYHSGGRAVREDLSPGREPGGSGPPPPAAVTVPAGRLRPKASRNETRVDILIVDGSTLYRDILADGLREFPEGRLTHVTDGEAALVRAASTRFEFFVVAGNLDDGDGIDLARRLRESGAAAFEPIVVLTGNPSESMANRAAAAGVTEIFRRQDVGELVTFMRRFLGIHRALPCRVIYVEDAADQRQALTAQMEEWGMRVDAFATADEAWQALAEVSYDLALCDVVLGGHMSGSRFINRIRRQPGETGRIPILAATAFDTPARRIELFHLGIDDYISKPIIPLELKARMRGLLARRRATEQNRLLLDATALGVTRIDAAGRILSMDDNAKSMFGAGREATLDRDVGRYIPGWRGTEPKSTGRRRTDGHRPDGSVFPLEVTAVALADGDDAGGWALLTRDLSDELALQQSLVRAKEHAERAARMKSEFLANMSHEIRTPLNAILGMVHLVLRDGISGKNAERLQKAERASQHLLDIVSSVLDLSKIEAEKLSLEVREVTIGGMLAQAASLLSEPARQKGLQLFVDARSLPANLLGDPVRLNQALLNYANNAIKFTERGSVTLAAEVVEDGDEYVLIRFEVRDTGVGFASEDAERLFEAFEQADNSVSRRYGGTGLGLAITRRLARLMGGDAGAAPNPGGGSTFWFTARLRRGPPGMVPGEAEEESVEAALRREGAGRRVLLVEDEPINAEVATELLQSVGLEVVSAADGVEALAMAAVGRFDLVLMDLQMPRMDGFETTRRIRSLPNRGRMPIVAMTANAFTEDRARCLEAGMDDFVAKPVDPPALYAAVRRWLVRPRF